MSSDFLKGQKASAVQDEGPWRWMVDSVLTPL